MRRIRFSSRTWPPMGVCAHRLHRHRGAHLHRLRHRSPRGPHRRRRRHARHRLRRGLHPRNGRRLIRQSPHPWLRRSRQPGGAVVRWIKVALWDVHPNDTIQPAVRKSFLGILFFIAVHVAEWSFSILLALPVAVFLQRVTGVGNDTSVWLFGLPLTFIFEVYFAGIVQRWTKT